MKVFAKVLAVFFLITVIAAGTVMAGRMLFPYSFTPFLIAGPGLVLAVILSRGILRDFRKSLFAVTVALSVVVALIFSFSMLMFTSTETSAVKGSMNYWGLATLRQAVQEYRREKGEYPPSLEALVPEYIKAVPVLHIVLPGRKHSHAETRGTVICRARSLGSPRKVELVYGGKAAGDVFVAGDFNDWNAASCRMSGNTAKGGRFVTLRLLPGIYGYTLKVLDDTVVTRDDDSGILEPAAGGRGYRVTDREIYVFPENMLDTGKWLYCPDTGQVLMDCIYAMEQAGE